MRSPISRVRRATRHRPLPGERLPKADLSPPKSRARRTRKPERCGRSSARCSQPTDALHRFEVSVIATLFVCLSFGAREIIRARAFGSRLARAGASTRVRPIAVLPLDIAGGPHGYRDPFRITDPG